MLPIDKDAFPLYPGPLEIDQEGHAKTRSIRGIHINRALADHKARRTDLSSFRSMHRTNADF